MSKFSFLDFKKPIIGLAPMAGYTDTIFRRLQKEIAPSCITISELCSADALAYNSQKTLDLIRFNKIERPYAVQLFGKHPEKFAKAVKVVEEIIKPDWIDINMGCPAKKVINSSHGVALMKNSQLACEIIQACRENSSLEITVKTRLGWSSPDEILSFAPLLEKAGASGLFLHGRTYQQGFSGTSDWQNIYKVKEILKIPVIGNGDIKSLKDFQLKLKNLDGVLVGRATFGNPWLIGELTGECSRPKDILEKIPLILRQAELAEEILGKKGMLELRKHLVCYVKGLENASDLRVELVSVNTAQDVKNIFAKFKL